MKGFIGWAAFLLRYGGARQIRCTMANRIRLRGRHFSKPRMQGFEIATDTTFRSQYSGTIRLLLFIVGPNSFDCF